MVVYKSTSILNIFLLPDIPIVNTVINAFFPLDDQQTDYYVIKSSIISFVEWLSPRIHKRFVDPWLHLCE